MTAEQFVRSSKAGDAVPATKPGKEKKPAAFPPNPEPLEVAVYDNHCHLEFEFDDELGVMPWPENLDRAQSVGIKGVVQVGVTLESSKWCAELATKDQRVLAAVALHPNLTNMRDMSAIASANLYATG